MWLSRSEWNEWLLLVANLAVVAGIVFLAVEIRQNNYALRSNVLQAVSSEMTPLYLAVASDASIRETWIKGLRQPESLSESERLQFNMILHVQFSNAQNWYLQLEDGILSDEVADGQWKTMATNYHAFPGFRVYWETRAYIYAPRFQKFIENEVFTRQPLDYTPEPISPN